MRHRLRHLFEALESLKSTESTESMESVLEFLGLSHALSRLPCLLRHPEVLAQAVCQAL